MTSFAELPTSVQGWFTSEKSSDREAALRAVLAESVVMDFGGEKIEGVDAVISLMTLVMPPGWIGPAEYSVLPRTPPDKWITVRATGSSSAPLAVFVPGAPRQTLSALDFKFCIDEAGRIARLAGQAIQLDPEGLDSPLQVGDSPEPFTIYDVNGRQEPILRDGTRATVVVFISNHCPFSLTWHSRLQQVAYDYASSNVRLLSINSNDPAQGSKDSIDYSRSRVARGEFVSPYLIDTDQAVARAWRARRTPEVFIVDGHGVLVYHGAPGADSSDQSDAATWIRDALDRLLSGRRPNPASTNVLGCSIKWQRR